MTRQRHLHRTALLATATAVVFAATATGSALAWNGSVQQVAATTPAAAPAVQASTGDAPATRATVAPAARPAVATATQVTTSAARATVTKTVAKKTVAKKTVATKTVAKKSSGVITISRYIDAPGSQKQIDKCKLVLWTHSPMWLAGHNWCGYQWMAFVKTGTTVKVTTGAAAGTYVVTGHLKLTRQSGSLPRLRADLVLQTCIGSGTGLTLLRRI